jgi:predicted esterase
MQIVDQLASQQPAPLLVFLHGSEEFGRDSDPQVRKHGPWDPVGSVGGGYDTDALAQLRRLRVLGLHGTPVNGDWQPASVSDAIEAYCSRHPAEVDATQICLTGVSRGGRGVLRTALLRLERRLPVRALAVFCPEPGHYSDTEIERLRQVPIYLFHNRRDPVCAYEQTEALQRRIGDRSSRLQAIEDDQLSWPGSHHVCWTNVYGHPQLYRWLLDPSAWPEPGIGSLPRSTAGRA